MKAPQTPIGFAPRNPKPVRVKAEPKPLSTNAKLGITAGILAAFLFALLLTRTVQGPTVTTYGNATAGRSASSGPSPAVINSRSTLRRLLPDRIHTDVEADRFAEYACAYLKTQGGNIDDFVSNVPAEFESRYPGFAGQARVILTVSADAACPEVLQ